MKIKILRSLYMKHVNVYYQKSPSSVAGIAAALKWMPDCNVMEFGSKRLKGVRSRMVSHGLARTTVNTYIKRVVMMFRWGVEEELIPFHLYSPLSIVRPLQAGRTAAKETQRVAPVPVADIEAAIAQMPAQAAAVAQLQYLVAARSGELLGLRPRDFEFKRHQPWVARVISHKNMYRGHDRYLHFGPKAQKILRPWLPADSLSSQRIFSYSTTSYWTAVQRACIRAHIKPWHPHQLRHTAATEIRAEFGLEAAQVALGHSRADVTQIYAERDGRLATVVAEQR